MVFDFQLIFFIITALWLIILTVLLVRIYLRLVPMLHKGKDKSILAILDKLIKDQVVLNKDINGLLTRVEKIENDSLTHVQKIGLIRFNPFQDTGGDQSFILALLDTQNTGILISGLYARSGMRWYVKKVVNGKGSEHELSEEEKKAIATAK